MITNGEELRMRKVAMRNYFKILLDIGLKRLKNPGCTSVMMPGPNQVSPERRHQRRRYVNLRVPPIKDI
jgi:hypothetical protein